MTDFADAQQERIEAIRERQREAAKQQRREWRTGWERALAGQL